MEDSGQPGARRGLRFRGHRQALLGWFWRWIAAGVPGVAACPRALRALVAPSPQGVRSGQVSVAVIWRVCLLSEASAP